MTLAEIIIINRYCFFDVCVYNGIVFIKIKLAPNVLDISHAVVRVVSILLVEG